MAKNNLKKTKNVNRYRVWLDQAKYDLTAAQSSLEAGHYEWVCYQSTQAVEKALKAVVVNSGFRPPRTHKLGVLAGMANSANELFKKVKIPFRKIESYTFISRYPFIIPGDNKTPREIVGKEDGTTCLELAEDVIEKIENFLKSEGTSEILHEDMNSRYFSEEEIDKKLEEIVEKVPKCEKLDVKKIILFGSFAREKTRPKDSTMDILVIAETELSFIERITYVRELLRGSEPIIEPLIYTPAEFNHLVYEEGEGFLESALEEGRVIWEA